MQMTHVGMTEQQIIDFCEGMKRDLLSLKQNKSSVVLERTNDYEPVHCNSGLVADYQYQGCTIRIGRPAETYRRKCEMNVEIVQLQREITILQELLKRKEGEQ